MILDLYVGDFVYRKIIIDNTMCSKAVIKNGSGIYLKLIKSMIYNKSSRSCLDTMIAVYCMRDHGGLSSFAPWFIAPSRFGPLALCQCICQGIFHPHNISCFGNCLFQMNDSAKWLVNNQSNHARFVCNYSRAHIWFG